LPHGIVLLIQRYGIGQRTPQRKLHFEIHITEHCNLNCTGCAHFSSIANEQYLDPADFERDMERLAHITNNQLAYIRLLGGEPLLHPECDTIMHISRKYFDKTAIMLVTNGILLPQQKERFWESARDNRVWIGISHYPIKLNLDAIRQLSVKYGVPCGYGIAEAGISEFSSELDKEQKMFKFYLDLQGRQNIKRSFTHCNWSNNCFTLRDGKLYTCHLIAHIKHFNNFFKKNLLVTEQDCIDIYKTNSVDEILTFLAKPAPFCRFCNINAITRGHKWSRSKKEITEWTSGSCSGLVHAEDSMYTP
jgi:MoaA/NifB/PqqE/SkfB family radical SAM enzyme